MSIGEKLTHIAENMPDVYGRGQMMGELSGYKRGYEEGVFDGGIAGREQCLMNHYSTTFYGSGTGEILQEIPFKPDIVLVYSTDACTSKIPYSYRGIAVDLRACGRHMGNFFYIWGNGDYRCGWLGSSLNSKYVTYQDGIFRYEMSQEQLPHVSWLTNVKYHLIAMRFPDETGKELFREQILSLPDKVPGGISNQLTVVKSVVDGYFTQAEWEALIAQKPNWEFLYY